MAFSLVLNGESILQNEIYLYTGVDYTDYVKVFCPDFLIIFAAILYLILYL